MGRIRVGCPTPAVPMAPVVARPPFVRKLTPQIRWEAAEVGATRATITVMSGPEAGRMIALDRGPVTVGRDPSCDVVTDDAAVSRQHVRFSTGPGGAFLVEDLGSTNGTSVTGRPVGRAFLVAGDHVELGPNVLLRFAFTDARDERLQHQLFESSVRDPLTDVYNRAYLMKALAAGVLQSRRDSDALSVVMLDVDHFKKFNDSFGHAAGDHALRHVTATLTPLVRAGDVFARYGGEEFVVVVRGSTHADAIALAERLRRGVMESPLMVGPTPVTVTVSGGVASSPEVAQDATGASLLELADRRLYVAKSEGRNCTRG